MNRLILGRSNDPWHNLALEDALFGAHGEGVVLYLWQNADTVVIGRNQNAWRECRTALLEGEGGKLARRMSGGGAVFHDLGNLNFTFITARKDYDLTRQLGVILAAVGALGVEAGFSGRNDLVAQGGAKFSGNAFRLSRDVGLHHGTLLIAADLERLGRYLAPPVEKLRAKGVESVRARVCNLSDLAPAADVANMQRALMAAFEKEYGPYETVDEACAAPEEAIGAHYAKHASWQWRMGASPAFDMALETRFDWGGLELCFNLQNGVVTSAMAYSDAMDEAFIRELPGVFVGKRFRKDALAAAAEGLQTPQASDVARWLADHEF